jgi:hypothetical protein
MSRCLAVVVLFAGAAALLSVFAPGARAAAASPPADRPAAVARIAASAGSWGKAIEVPGTGALNKGGNATVVSVSCAAAGGCSAGGPYRDGSGHFQVFVVTQRNGRWGKAVEVPGLAALDKGGTPDLASVSCGAAGSCSAGGFYTAGAGHTQAFVVTQRNGRWGKAIEVPGTGALNKGRRAQVASVSCAAVGSCSAGGSYRDGSGHTQAFVVTQRNGRWGKAIEVPRTGALNKGGNADVTSVSCGAAGSCSAGGFYLDGSGRFQALVVAQRSGHWGKAVEVPGLALLNKAGGAHITSVSCAAAGNCSAGGTYQDLSGALQAFVVTQRNGLWGKAVEVPGLAALNKGGTAEISEVSCAAAGSCSAGGFYADSSFSFQAFVVTQRSGHWGKAIEVPGTGVLNKGGGARVASVSCAAAGSCSAGGSYQDGSGHTQAFLVTERSGHWGKAIEAPGTGALNKGGDASVGSVSCAAPGSCSAGGGYKDGSARFQAFVVSRT